MYRLRSGRTVDGVIALDPVALSYLLRATGPVQVRRDSPLTAANAVEALLSDAYEQYKTNVEQNEYFADVTASVFEALVNEGTDAHVLLRELARAAGERRILIWSAHPAEQRLLEETVLGGDLPAEDGDQPEVGVFLNDGGGAKLGYYLTQSARLSTVACRSDGRRELRLQLTLGSTASASGLRVTPAVNPWKTSASALTCPSSG